MGVLSSVLELECLGLLLRSGSREEFVNFALRAWRWRACCAGGLAAEDFFEVESFAVP